ncbi:MAG: response regulator [Deltaproteobacteria bacterium]|nr:MAG: response regulator [Deltaproteobacteria bacterium]
MNVRGGIFHAPSYISDKPAVNPTVQTGSVVTSKKKILIVEDEEKLRELVTLLLSSRGYEIECVSDGLAALGAIRRKAPDLVLLDIMIPEIDGFEVCRQIKNNELTRQIPVVMLTAKRHQTDFARAEEVGADWYLVKPFKSAMLVETIMRFLPGESALPAS